MAYNNDRGKRNYNERRENENKLRDKLQKPRENTEFREKVNSRGQIQCDICSKFGHGARTCWYNQDNIPNNKKTCREIKNEFYT